MLDRAEKQQDYGCPRCGNRETASMGGLVAQNERGYFNFYQCPSCGHVNHRKVPQAPSNSNL